MGTATSRSAPASIALGSILAITSRVRRTRALEFVERRLGVLVARRLQAGEAMRGDLGVVAEGLDLARERVHIGPNSQRQIDLGIELRRRGVGLGLIENRKKRRPASG